MTFIYDGFKRMSCSFSGFNIKGKTVFKDGSEGVWEIMKERPS